jgi:hypothetical protein
MTRSSSERSRAVYETGFEVEPTPPSEGFRVDVTGIPDLHSAGQQVIFHGINKSGSLTLTNVLADAYYAEDRANQFFSTYLSVPKSHDKIRRVISHSSGHAFFGGHYLYDSYGGRSADQVLVTQFGIGYAPDAPDWRTLSGEEVLDRAITRIEKDVSCFGLAEHFEETAFMVAALCGLSEVGPWVRDTRNQDRPLVPAVAPARDRPGPGGFPVGLRALRVGARPLPARGVRAGPDLERYKAACRSQYNDRLSLEGQPIT